LFDLTPSIGRDEGHVIALAYDMGLTPHTPEKSLLPIIDEGIISFDIHISAIGEVGVTCQTLRQINSDIAMIFRRHMIASLLMPPGGIFPTVSRVTFTVPFTTVLSERIRLKQ
jgi:hypothetical protein